MGRLLKNRALDNGAYAVRMPFGSSTGMANPNSPVDGMMRWNAALNRPEYYYNSAWQGISHIGTVTIVKDSFTGDGATTGYTMTVSHTTGKEAEVIIFVGSVYQNPGVAYTVNGTALSFTSAPPNGQAIVILHNFNSTNAA